MPQLPSRARRLAAQFASACLLVAGTTAHSTEFSVTPIRAELRQAAPSETITVINHAPERLRVAIRLFAWTQDDKGADVYTESSDLVYFPRQIDLEPDSRRVVRVGLKSAQGETERAYRLFVEEIASPLTSNSGTPQVNFQFRFGVPIFVAPVTKRTGLQVGQPTLQGGKVSIPVRNEGTVHVRLARVTVSDGAGFSKDEAGWYSLAGAGRTYEVPVPAEVCRKAKTLKVVLEGEDVRVDRQLDVDASNCS